MATLTYGAMVDVVREGARQIEVTLLTTAGTLAATVFEPRGRTGRLDVEAGHPRPCLCCPAATDTLQRYGFDTLARR